MNKIIVVVKMWFDSVNGNTYHRVKLFTDSEIYESEVTYGYETQYIQTARKIYDSLINKLAWEISRKEFVEMCEFEVINVNKKELYK